jgi:uncharacterized protein YfiM (DUF2279 family)
MLRATFTLLLAFFSFNLLAQDSLSLNKKKLRLVVGGASVGYAGAMTGLYQLWYKDSEKQPFAFFNDNAEWKQIDKAGHFISGFYLSYGASKAFRWTGLSQNKSDLYGAIAGFAIMVPVEIFDGYSEAYGASTGDVVADAAGPLLFLGQKKMWNEVRLIPKISYHHTSFAARRPETLGATAAERILKDYNGHTFWLSVDADKFGKFPKWLNVAVGYGAHNMIYARDSQNHAAGLTPYRQYYISLDLDPSAIKTRSPFVKTLLFIAGIIKIPGPTMEFSNGKTRFHALYF